MDSVDYLTVRGIEVKFPIINLIINIIVNITMIISIIITIFIIINLTNITMSRLTQPLL